MISIPARLTLSLALLLGAGCKLTDDDREKLEDARVDLEQLADQMIITYPANSAVITEEMATVRVDAPAAAGVETMVLYVDGIAMSTDDNGAPWEMQFESYYWADGAPHTLLVKAITKNGTEVRNNTPVQFSIDSSLNKILSFESQELALQDQNSAVMTFTAVDSATNYEVAINEQQHSTSNTVVELSNLPEGITTLRYRARLEVSETSTLVGPWSAPATVTVLPAEEPIANPPAITVDEQGYKLAFSFTPLADGDSYRLAIRKTNVEPADDTQFFNAASSGSIGATGMAQGVYEWYLERTNAIGQIAHSSTHPLTLGLYRRTMGGSGYDQGKRLVETSDGGAVILASTTSYGDANGDDWLIKVDSEGNTIGEYIHQLPGHARMQEMVVASDGSVVVAGMTPHPGRKGYIARIDMRDSANQRVIWEHEYVSTPAGTESFDAVVELMGKVYVTGEYTSCSTTDGKTSCAPSEHRLYTYDLESGVQDAAVAIPQPAGFLLEDIGSLESTSTGNFLASCSAMPSDSGGLLYHTYGCIMEFSHDGSLNWSWVSSGPVELSVGLFATEHPLRGYVLSGQTDHQHMLAFFSDAGVKEGVYSATGGFHAPGVVAFDSEHRILRLVSDENLSFSELWLTDDQKQTHTVASYFSSGSGKLVPQDIIKAKSGGLLMLFSDGSNENADLVVIRADENGKYN